MNTVSPLFTVRDAISIIKKCETSDEMERTIGFLLSELPGYSLADQGLIMTIAGLQTIKITDRLVYRESWMNAVEEDSTPFTG